MKGKEGIIKQRERKRAAREEKSKGKRMRGDGRCTSSTQNMRANTPGSASPVGM
jgi:hypothetical protein